MSEAKPYAFVIVRSDGSQEVVLAPLTDNHDMDEGDVAWMLYAAEDFDAVTAERNHLREATKMIEAERDSQRGAHRIAMQRAIRKHAEVEAKCNQLAAVITRLDDALADMEDIAHGDLGLMVSQARALCRLDLREGVEL